MVRQKLYIIEVRLAETGTWRVYGGSGGVIYAHTTRKSAVTHMKNAKTFNVKLGLKWSFRVSVYQTKEETCY